MIGIRDRVDVVLLGENNLVREGMRRIIDTAEFVVKVSETCDTYLLDRETHEHTAELLVIDAGHAACADDCRVDQLRQSHATSKIVVLHDIFDFDFMVDAFKSGVDGYIVKNISCEPLLESLRLVVMGEKIMPSALAELLPDYGRKVQPAAPVTDLSAILSEREIETLRCVCRGDPNKVIAQRLSISEATVKVHVKAILRKLRLRNRTQAVAWTMKAGVDLSLPSEEPAKPRSVRIPAVSAMPALGAMPGTALASPALSSGVLAA